jgi:peptide subunit release factor RF-3
MLYDGLDGYVMELCYQYVKEHKLFDKWIDLPSTDQHEFDFTIKLQNNNRKLYNHLSVLNNCQSTLIAEKNTGATVDNDKYSVFEKDAQLIKNKIKEYDFDNIILNNIKTMNFKFPQIKGMTSDYLCNESVYDVFTCIKIFGLLKIN